MKKRIIALALAAVTAASLVGCGGSAPAEAPAPAETAAAGEEAAPADDAAPAEEAAPEVGGEVAVSEWNIPVLSAVTGPIAFVGKPASWAAEYAAKVINEQGGINGVPVSVKIFDTKFDTAEVASCLSQVVDDSIIVLGPMDAPAGEVAGQIIYDAQVPNIGCYSYDEARANYAPYATGYMTDSEEGDVKAAEKWIALNPDIKKIVIFTCPSDASQVATADMLEEFLPTIGCEVAGVVEVETDTLDCGPAAVQALNLGADGYISVLRADENAKVVMELRSRGVEEGRRITCGFSAFSDNYIGVAGPDALDGTYIWNKLDPTYDGPEWNALKEAYIAEFGSAPTSNPVPDFYDAMMAIKQCFEELNITGDPANAEAEKLAIAEWLNNSPTIHGLQGDFHWENGKKIADYKYFQFEGDQYVSVDAQ